MTLTARNHDDYINTQRNQMIQAIHTLSAQEQATSAHREQTAIIITTAHLLIMMGHQAKIDNCKAAINEDTNFII